MTEVSLIHKTGWGGAGPDSLKGSMPEQISFTLPNGETVHGEQFNPDNVGKLLPVLDAPDARQYIDFATIIAELAQDGHTPTDHEIWDAIMEKAKSPGGEYLLRIGRQAVGMLGVYPEPPVDGTEYGAGIHYSVDPRQRGKKIAQYGSALLHGVLLERTGDFAPGLTAVYTIAPDNIPSRRVAEAVGATRDPRYDGAIATSGAVEEGYSKLLN